MALATKVCGEADCVGFGGGGRLTLTVELIGRGTGELVGTKGVNLIVEFDIIGAQNFNFGGLAASEDCGGAVTAGDSV